MGRRKGTANLAFVPGRYEFSLPERPLRDGWFRLGQVDVTTTALLAGLGVLSMVLYAIDKTLVYKGAFESSLVRDGEWWRVVTWPLVNPPTDIWVALTIVVFWFFGHRIEDRVGRQHYTVLIAAMIVIPAVVVTALGTRNDLGSGRWTALAFGLGLLSIGLLVVFALDSPGAQFFFGIPAWVIAGVFVAIDVLRLTADRLWAQLVLECLVIVVGCIGARQLGLVETLSFIPRVAGRNPSPTGRAPARGRSRGGAPKRRRPGKGAPGTVVPGPWGDSGPTLLEQAELDVLLDKISAGGTESLTPQERQRLQALSKRLRGS